MVKADETDNAHVTEIARLWTNMPIGSEAKRDILFLLDKLSESAYALEESVKLQAHYARLLNSYVEGIVFLGEELRAIATALEIRRAYWQRSEGRRLLTETELDEYNAVVSALTRVRYEIEKREGEKP